MSLTISTTAPERRTLPASALWKADEREAGLRQLAQLPQFIVLPGQDQPRRLVNMLDGTHVFMQSGAIDHVSGTLCVMWPRIDNVPSVTALSSEPAAREFVALMTVQACALRTGARRTIGMRA